MVIEHMCDSSTGEGALDALRSQFADRCRDDALWLTRLHAAGLAVAGRAPLSALDEFSGDEVAGALGWSRSMAARNLALADDLVGRLPRAHEAMAEGRLELSKARVISEWTRELEADHARHVCAVVLPEAPRQNQSELIASIGAVAASIDPDWARRRQQAAAARADVYGRANPSGTTDLHGRDLDPEQTWTSMAHIEALAVELRGMLRARGLRRPIGWLRGQVLYRLTDGSATGDDDALLADLADDITTLLARDDPEPDDGPGPDEGDDRPDDGGDPPDDGPDHQGPGSRPGPAVPPEPDAEPVREPDAEPGPEPKPKPEPKPERGPSGPMPDSASPDSGSPESGSPESGSPESGSPESGSQENASPEDAAAEEPGPAADVRHAVRRGVLAIRMRLSTALGLDDRPAELAAKGSLLAPTARSMIDKCHAGEWRLLLTDPDGRLEHLILLTTRPEATPGGPGRRRAGPRHRGQGRGRIERRSIVELQVPTALLGALDPDDHPTWARLLRQAQARVADPAITDPARHPATSTRDAGHRRARAELDRWIRARDRHCIGVMCGRPAHGNDLDHTQDWAHGGITAAANLGTTCRHCHRLKHIGGWHLAQPTPGTFRWTSRGGATYVVRPRPVMRPLPDPRPRPDGRPRTSPEEHLVGDHHDEPAGPGDAPAWIPVPEPRRRERATDPDEPVPDEPVPGEPVPSGHTTRCPDEPPF